MKNIGVIEGFFGPQWPMKARLSYADFLSRHGGSFYIYAPKQDPHLRKKWRDDWDSQYLDHLKKLIQTFHQAGILFGVGFSPFGLGSSISNEDRKLLLSKVRQMNDLGIDVLGLFFDDMPVSSELSQNQMDCLSLIQSEFKNRIIFCPSYYTPDPILDKVFGKRPDHYLEDIGEGTSLDVSIAWTGPKVISPVIDGDHLKEIAVVLKRKPFIWENLFANDGPKNCKFLKLKPFTGRDQYTFDMSEGFGFNMMNQAELSKILYLSSSYALEGLVPESAYEKAIVELCSEPFAHFLKKYAELFLKNGLDNFSPDDMKRWKEELKEFPDPAAKEIIDWLDGLYNVGSECLTD